MILTCAREELELLDNICKGLAMNLDLAALWNSRQLDQGDLRAGTKQDNSEKTDETVSDWAWGNRGADSSYKSKKEKERKRCHRG